MPEMDRRTFLLATAQWLLLTGIAPVVSGCSRALRWSDSQGGTDFLQALPRFRSNAGLGWELSLGRFQSPADPLSTGIPAASA